MTPNRRKLGHELRLFQADSCRGTLMRLQTNLTAELCARVARFLLVTIFAVQTLLPRALQADQIQHKDGRILDGKFVRMSKTAEDPLKNLDAETAKPIFLCDDN